MFKGLLIAASILLLATNLMATPVTMTLNKRMLHPASMIVANAASFYGSQLSPMIFQPKLVPQPPLPNTFNASQSATTEGRGIFTIFAPAGTLLNATVQPQAGGFPLDGRSVAGSTPPIIANTNLASSDGTVDSSGNFTMISAGKFTLTMGGNLTGTAATLAGLYQSNSSLMLRITDRTTGAAIQIPFQIFFHYVSRGQIEAVRSLIFPPITLTPGNSATQTIPANSPSSAELTYSPNTGSFSIVKTTVCLAANGETPPDSCSCNTSGASAPYIRVSFNGTGIISSSCVGSGCRVFIGGGACYPANLPAGIYRGKSTIAMTYT